VPAADQSLRTTRNVSRNSTPLIPLPPQERSGKFARVTMRNGVDVPETTAPRSSAGVVVERDLRAPLSDHDAGMLLFPEAMTGMIEAPVIGDRFTPCRIASREALRAYRQRHQRDHIVCHGYMAARLPKSNDRRGSRRRAIASMTGETVGRRWLAHVLRQLLAKVHEHLVTRTLRARLRHLRSVVHVSGRRRTGSDRFPLAECSSSGRCDRVAGVG
jgi:hypothetical protein